MALRPVPVTPADSWYTAQVTVRVVPPKVERSAPTPKSAAIDAAEKNLGYTGGPVAVKAKLWKPGRTLHIAFLDGEKRLKEAVINTALEWTKYANIRFEPVGHADEAEIRIAFQSQTGSWCYIGTDALLIKAPAATMGLAVDRQTSQNELRGTVLYQFGLALGLVQAHLSPLSQIRWEVDALNAYAHERRLDRDFVRRTFLDVFDRERVYHAESDPKSIMVMPLDPAWTVDHLEVRRNHDLSETDKSFIAALYPWDLDSQRRSTYQGIQDPESRRETNEYGVTHAADGTKLWTNGRVLRIAFLEGDPKIQEKVLDVARQWCQYANITFERTEDSESAEIRVAFDLRSGSWSYVGSESLAIPKEKPTMNYGWLKPSTPDVEYSRTVLHVFGHALGLLNSHLSPSSNIPWDAAKVLAYYKSTNGWSEATTRSAVLDKYPATNVVFDHEFDSASVMCYPIPKELTVDGWGIPTSNAEISDGDKRFIQMLYPFQGSFEFQPEREAPFPSGSANPVPMF